METIRCSKCGAKNSRGPATCEECGAKLVAADIAPTLASLGSRFIGQILDSLVALVIVLLSMLALSASEEIGGFIALIGIVAALLYILLADGLHGGQSYGKRVVKTAVVDATSGRPCTFGQSLVRNAFLAILGIIDWVFILGMKQQRLGDKVANTIVVKSSLT